MTVRDVMALLPPYTDVRLYALNMRNYATELVSDVRGHESKSVVRIAPDNRASNTIKIYV